MKLLYFTQCYAKFYFESQSKYTNIALSYYKTATKYICELILVFKFENINEKDINRKTMELKPRNSKTKTNYKCV